jgi:hypothetical protein
MTVRKGFRPTAILKAVARPFLLPVLRKLASSKTDKAIPRISRRDRVRESDVATNVSVRSDQTILVNGKPFFPIGLYYALDEIEDSTSEGLMRLKAMGFNTIAFTGDVDTEDQLDRIASAGLHVWYRPPGGLHADYRRLKKIVMKFAKHPAVLFWGMDDEPVFNAVDFTDSKTGCRIVRELDPYHPLLCNQWFSCLSQGDEMMKWASLADIYGFSMYPIPSWRWGRRLSLVEDGWPHSIAVVGRQTDLWKQYAPGKPIIPVLQAWAWNCLEDGEAAYPSYSEGRFMAYQAVIHGAKGLHYYGSVRTSRPIFECGIPPPQHYDDLEQSQLDFLASQLRNDEFWNYQSVIVSELARMSEVFTAHDADWSPAVQEITAGGQVECRVKQYLDSTVTLCVNPSAFAVSVQMLAPQLRDQELNLWGQERSINVSGDGRFQDRLEPYGVRIYSDLPDLLAGLESVPIISGVRYG